MATVARTLVVTRPWVLSSASALAFTSALALALGGGGQAPVGRSAVSQPIAVANNYSRYWQQPPNLLTSGLVSAYNTRQALTARPGYPNYQAALNAQVGQNTLPLGTVVIPNPSIPPVWSNPNVKLYQQPVTSWQNSLPLQSVPVGSSNVDNTNRRSSSTAALDWRYGQALTIIGGGLQPITPPVWTNPVIATSGVAALNSVPGVWQSNLPLLTIPPTPFTPPIWTNPVLRISDAAARDWRLGQALTIIGGGQAPVGSQFFDPPVLRTSSIAVLNALSSVWQNYVVLGTPPGVPIIPPVWVNPVLRVSSVAALDWRLGQALTIIGGGQVPVGGQFFDFPVLRISSIAATNALSNVWQSNAVIVTPSGVPIFPPVWVNPVLRISSVAALDWRLGQALSIIGGGLQPFTPSIQANLLPVKPREYGWIYSSTVYQSPVVTQNPFINPIWDNPTLIKQAKVFDSWQNNLLLLYGKPFTPSIWPNPTLRSYTASLDWRLGQALTIIGGGLKPIVPPVWVNPILRVSDLAAQRAWQDAWQNPIIVNTVPLDVTPRYIAYLVERLTGKNPLNYYIVSTQETDMPQAIQLPPIDTTYQKQTITLDFGSGTYLPDGVTLVGIQAINIAVYSGTDDTPNSRIVASLIGTAPLPFGSGRTNCAVLIQLANCPGSVTYLIQAVANRSDGDIAPIDVLVPVRVPGGLT